MFRHPTNITGVGHTADETWIKITMIKVAKIKCFKLKNVFDLKLSNHIEKNVRKWNNFTHFAIPFISVYMHNTLTTYSYGWIMHHRKGKKNKIGNR